MAARFAPTIGKNRRLAAPMTPEPPQSKGVAARVELAPSVAPEVRAAATAHFKPAPRQEPPAASVDADSVPSLRAMEVARAPEAEPVNDDDGRLEERFEEPSPQPESNRATLPSFRKQRQAWSRRVGWAVVASAAVAATFALRAGEAPSEPTRRDTVPVAASRIGAVDATAEQAATAPTRNSVEPAAPQSSHASDEIAYDAQRLGFALRWAKSHAEDCHRWGRAVGTVDLAITFSSEGRVTDFVLSGEPVAGAPVAGCVESYYRAMLIPAFEGEPFTIHEPLTLR